MNKNSYKEINKLNFLFYCRFILTLQKFAFSCLHKSIHMISIDPHKEVMKQSIILGIYFMLTYLTYLSFANIITYIAQNQEGQYDYGPIVALAFNYFVYMVTLIFSPAITHFKKQFQISAICHLINYAVYIPDFKGDLGLIMGIIGALFGGYGAAIYWVSQGGYMMKLFKRYGIKTNQQGKYFGVTNAIVYGSSLFGAIVTTFGLGLFGSQIYFIILTGLALASWAVCTYFLDSLEQPLPNNSIVKNQHSSLISNESFNQVIENAPQKINFKLVKSIFMKTISYYPKMYYLYLVVVIDGVLSGFISTYLSKLLPEGIRSDLNVGYMLMVEGVGCILGAMASAFSSDKFHVANIGIVGMFILLVASAATYINHQINFSQVYFPYMTAFFWGFLMNYITSWQSVSCAKWNKGCLESFSIVRQIQAMSFIGFAIAMVIVDNTIDLLIYLPIMIGIGVAAAITLTIAKKKQEKADISIEN